MPRRGQGQQATRVASGQQYGQAQAQEEAQAAVPLPQMQPPRRLMKPGQAAFARRSERPNESIMTSGSPVSAAPRKDPVQEFRVANAAALYEAISSTPYASPFARNAARRLRSQSPDISQFADKGMMPDVGDL